MYSDEANYISISQAALCCREGALLLIAIIHHLSVLCVGLLLVSQVAPLPTFQPHIRLEHARPHDSLQPPLRCWPSRHTFGLVTAHHISSTITLQPLGVNVLSKDGHAATPNSRCMMQFVSFIGRHHRERERVCTHAKRPNCGQTYTKYD